MRRPTAAGTSRCRSAGIASPIPKATSRQASHDLVRRRIILSEHRAALDLFSYLLLDGPISREIEPNPINRLSGKNFALCLFGFLFGVYIQSDRSAGR